MAISAYILKIVEKNSFLRLQMRAKEDFNCHQLFLQISNTLTLKTLGFLLPVQYWGRRGCFLPPLCKIRSRHPRELKLTGLIAYIMFYKIYKFESSIVTNDVIRTSFPKTMVKFGPPGNQISYISFKRY